ncbi:MAG: hypothetical protein KAQ98_14085 [Bacteriovoracaceae bacterium]|nr:hypothetical protein [Bacteriovoracaceae bacterium]
MKFLSCILILIFSINFTFATEQLSKSHYPVATTLENSQEIDPSKMNFVDVDDFNKKTMPQIMNLEFYSYSDNHWHPVLWDQINDYCYARRTAIDSFLWFGAPLKADWTGRSSYECKMEGTYILPGFRNSNYKLYSWVETARINVIGKLKTKSGMRWNNHEAVVVNTNDGIKIIDPSFSNKLLDFQQWFEHFAPEESNRRCIPTDREGLAAINMELVMTQQFNMPWNTDIPYCGYLFDQRLNVGDTLSMTAYFTGTKEEKFLSAKFYKYFEEDLLKDY